MSLDRYVVGSGAVAVVVRRKAKCQASAGREL